uniref:peptidylamidoglycolate lyase n=1 Tax=Cuerna arida TaxID=1464854 RepID=A0A1B6G878_9HEMI
MIMKKSYLMVIAVCPFLCFHVTADLNTEIKGDASSDEHEGSHTKQPLLANEENFNRAKRSSYQQPLLNNPSSLLSEDWSSNADWPGKNGVHFGQVAGVTVNKQGEVVVFHRGDHVWGAGSFDRLNQYLEKDKGPISSPTVLVIHPETGAVLQKWGENMFYLPHGITLDQEENVWLTDVALHQVFKFPPLGRNERSPLLALGKPFVPGNSAVRFCKPTSVAVTPWGDFFVADGYCNSRLIKFNKSGVKITEIGHATFTFGMRVPDPYAFNIPHALTLVEDRKLVCVADRENGRVLCFDWNNGTYAFSISSPQIGSLIYSVTYSPLEGGLFFVVNGQERKYNAAPVRGYVISASNQRLLAYFGDGLKMPHDLAVSPDGRFVYVAEIGPNIVHKYSHNGTLGPAVGTTVNPQSPPELLAPISPQSLNLRSPQGTVLPAVLVTCAAILFGAAIVTAALVYSRARRRGMSTAEHNFYKETTKLVEDEM